MQHGGAPMSQVIYSHTLPETGFLRIRQIVGDPTAIPPIPAIIPVAQSTWWEGVRAGRFPAPVKTLGRRITAWRVEDIRDLISAISQEGAK
jgi:predicted DNA-binding transcriptional regulator AlpA